MKNIKNISIITALFLFLLQSYVWSADNAPSWVIGWGDNTGGETTDIPSISYSNGVFSTKDNPNVTNCVSIGGQVLSNVAAIAAGGSHSLALKTDGTVVGWGDNSTGEATGHPTAYPGMTNGQVQIDGIVLSKVKAIAAGRANRLALKEDGTITAFGAYNGQDKINVPSGLSNVVAVATGESYGLALKSNGTVTTWGATTDLTAISNAIAIATGKDWGSHDLALQKDGTVLEWDNRNGIPKTVPGLSNVVAISSGDECLALLKSGHVVEWWGETNHLVSINGDILTNVTAIASGTGFDLALKKDGTVAAWGGTYGGLFPTVVPAGLSNVVAIAAGGNYCLAITTNSAVAEKFRQK
jgi:alpha-tubulin suppressor-like RCC1 family protein